MNYYYAKKGQIFSFLQQRSKIKFFVDSELYDTARSQFFFILKFEYLSENETKIENILTHWSVAQAGSNDGNNWGLKISLDCPFSLL